MSYARPMSRRAFLRYLALSFGAAAGMGLRAPLQPRIEVEERTLNMGTSQGGRPLIVYRYGYGSLRLFILGGQHGGPEANTTRLAGMLREYFYEKPSEIPPSVTIYVMPEGNPDGLAMGSRLYMSGVDPNRNWAGPDWQSDAYDSNGLFRPGLGGPQPFSEPETTALADWLLRARPHFTINYHSAGGFMFGGGEGLAGELAGLYAQASGYPRPTGGGGAGSFRSPLTYRATGHMNGWQRTVGMGGCLIELTTPHDPEFNRNFAGVRAVLERLQDEGMQR